MRVPILIRIIIVVSFMLLISLVAFTIDQALEIPYKADIVQSVKRVSILNDTFKVSSYVGVKTLMGSLLYMEDSKWNTVSLEFVEAIKTEQFKALEPALLKVCEHLQKEK